MFAVRDSLATRPTTDAERTADADADADARARSSRDAVLLSSLHASELVLEAFEQVDSAVQHGVPASFVATAVEWGPPDSPLTAIQLHTLYWAKEREEKGVIPLCFSGVKRSRGGVVEPPGRVWSGWIADAPGLGKTWVIAALIRSTIGVGPTLVVAPPLTIPEWQSVCSRFSLSHCTLYGTNQRVALREMTQRMVDVVIVSFGSKLNPDISSLVTRLVVDEAHDFFNSSSKHGPITGVVGTWRRSCPRCKSLWLVTGTPFVSLHLESSVRSFHKQANCMLGYDSRLAGCLHPSATRSSIKDMLMRHGIESKRTPQASLICNPSTGRLSVPLLKHEVLRCGMSADEARLYATAKCHDLLRRTSACALPASRRVDAFFACQMAFLNGDYDTLTELLRQTVLSAYISRAYPVDVFHAKAKRCLRDANGLIEACRLHAPRLRTVADAIRSRLTDPVFCVAIITSSDAICAHLTRAGIDFVRVGFGGVGKTQTGCMQTLVNFVAQRGRVLVCRTSAASVGINLPHVSHIFLLDSILDASQFVQACARARRLGSIHEEVVVTKVSLEGTVDDAIMAYHAQADKGDHRALLGTQTSAHHAMDDKQVVHVEHMPVSEPASLDAVIRVAKRVLYLSFTKPSLWESASRVGVDLARIPGVPVSSWETSATRIDVRIDHAFHMKAAATTGKIHSSDERTLDSSRRQRISMVQKVNFNFSIPETRLTGGVFLFDAHDTRLSFSDDARCYFTSVVSCERCPFVCHRGARILTLRPPAQTRCLAATQPITASVASTASPLSASDGCDDTRIGTTHRPERVPSLNARFSTAGAPAVSMASSCEVRSTDASGAATGSPPTSVDTLRCYVGWICGAFYVLDTPVDDTRSCVDNTVLAQRTLMQRGQPRIRVAVQTMSDRSVWQRIFCKLSKDLAERAKTLLGENSVPVTVGRYDSMLPQKDAVLCAPTGDVSEASTCKGVAKAMPRRYLYSKTTAM